MSGNMTSALVDVVFYSGPLAVVLLIVFGEYVNSRDR